MGRKIAAALMLLTITGCTEFDLYIKKEGTPGKLSKVLIGSFQFRNLTYDPYVSSEYREALKFAFFKRGVNAFIIPDAEVSAQNEPDKLQLVLSKYSGDIIIQGIISQRESGFLTDREIHSSINLLVYSADGRQISESYYHSGKQAADESVKRDAVDSFVDEFLAQTVKR